MRLAGQETRNLIPCSAEGVCTNAASPFCTFNNLCIPIAKSLGFIDFAAVTAAVSLEQIQTHYGVLQTLKPHGATGLRDCCPIHKGDDPKQFAVNLKKNTWNCFSQCKHGGNMLEFVMQMEDCGLSEAAWKTNEWFGLGMEVKAAERIRTKRHEATHRQARTTSGAAGDAHAKEHQR